MTSLGHARERDGELEGGALECAVGGDGNNKCGAAELSRGLRLCGGMGSGWVGVRQDDEAARMRSSAGECSW